LRITALTGSCWSSYCSTRNSLDRWAAAASDSLAPSAADVVAPHAVDSLIPALTVSPTDSVRDSPDWLLREEEVCPVNGSGPLLPPCPRPDAVEVAVPAERDAVTEPVPPIVLV